MTKTPPDQKAFWDWLARQQAERQDMSLRQVALQAGLSVSTLYQRRIYGGQPSLLTCRKLAAFFDFDEDYVLTLAGHRPAVPNYDLRQVLRALYPLAPARLI
ncbi:MAG: helix-turn-helix domain-containing protein, partial [Chloroflexi bacterium]|nr:helix-turn-helix domain-containing protein [Chloroflexota bacterium]